MQKKIQIKARKLRNLKQDSIASTILTRTKALPPPPFINFSWREPFAFPVMKNSVFVPVSINRDSQAYKNWENLFASPVPV
ncbi:MAG: hypothetical protein AAF518_00540 [Spirochaetota bacterium]